MPNSERSDLRSKTSQGGTPATKRRRFTFALMDVTKITQPDIFLWGLRIQEPTTMLTDLLIAGVCLYAFYQLKRIGPKTKVTKLVRGFMLFMALANIIGGIIGHSFLYLVGEWGKLIGWYVSMFSITYIERASILHAGKLISEKVVKFFLVANIVELIILVALTTYYIHFRFVEFHSAYGFLVVVMSFHLYTYIKLRDVGSKYYLYAIGTLLVTVVIFEWPVIIHEFFNHKDFAHLFIALSIYLIYKGTLRLGTYERPLANPSTLPA